MWMISAFLENESDTGIGCWENGEMDSVQFSSVAQSCPTLCNQMNFSMPSLPVHHQLLEFTQNYVQWVSDAIQPSHPLSSPSPPAPNPYQHQSFSNESTLRMRWPEYWSLSFSIIPSKEHPGLISFRMAWLDLLAVQGKGMVNKGKGSESEVSQSYPTLCMKCSLGISNFLEEWC